MIIKGFKRISLEEIQMGNELTQPKAISLEVEKGKGAENE